MNEPIIVARAELVSALSLFGGPRAALATISGLMGAPELPAPLAAICDALEGRGDVSISIQGEGIEHRFVVR